MSNYNVFDDAVGKWKDICARLGVDGNYLTGKHGPCPLCGGKDRYRFDDKGGTGSYICNQCGAGNAYTLIKALNNWTDNQAILAIKGVVGYAAINSQPGEDNEKIRQYMRKIYNESSPITEDTPAWKYLQRRCGPLIKIPAILRFHPELYHSEEKAKYPAMVALMGMQKPFSGIHRTYLTHDGQKAKIDAPRKSLGRTSIIKLGACLDLIGIAEGIETALCASQLYQIPVWSSTNDSGMANFQPPDHIKIIHIFGDNDHSFAGQSAAYLLAKRMSQQHRRVVIHIPDMPGHDWADVWSKQKNKEEVR